MLNFSEPVVSDELFPAEDVTPSITVTVSDDKLSAYLTIEQTPLEPYQVTEDAVFDALAAAQVEFGVLMEEIERVVAARLYSSHLLIAQGQPPRPGQDGRLEYLFDRAEVGRPTDMGYRVDFYDLNLVENVTTGQVLVRQIPAIPGEPGMTVQGRLISVPRVQEARLPAGKGTKISETNPRELVAAVDGFVRMDKKSFNQVVVDQMFDVFGDVDMSTGHLDIEGSIKIKGDIKEGFKVQATGDVIVGGSVEGCTVTAGGRVEVKGGVIGGRNRAVVIAGEDVNTRFAGQADITAGNSIIITEEALNCNLQAESAVIVGKDKKFMGAIFGGQAVAGHEIRAVNVGAEVGTRTYLRVGVRPALLARRQQMQADIQQYQQKLKQIEVQLETLTKRLDSRTADRQARKIQRVTLEEQRDKWQAEIRTMLAHLEAAGLLPAASSQEALESQIKETAETLLRVEAHLTRLLAQPDEATAEANAATLLQLKMARQNLINKLTQLKTEYTQAQDPWSRVPRQIKINLEVARTRLAETGIELERLASQESADQKLEEAIAQLSAEQGRQQQTLSQWQAELKSVQQRIEETSQQEPRIVVSDTLWAGVEVVMLAEKRRFTDSLKGVDLRLSANQAGPIVALSL